MQWFLFLFISFFFFRNELLVASMKIELILDKASFTPSGTLFNKQSTLSALSWENIFSHIGIFVIKKDVKSF